MSVESIEFEIIELDNTNRPSVGVKLSDSYMLIVELFKEKGVKKPFLRLTLTSENEVVDGAEIPYDRLDKLKQPRYDTFRVALRKALPKGISIAEIQSFIKTKILPILTEKYRKYLEAKRREREEKLKRLLRKYKTVFKEIDRNPVKHVLEVVDFHHIGDKDAKIEILGCLVSIHLPREKRLSAVVQGPSAAGKNNLVKAFMRVTPKKWWLVITRLTSRALDYMPKSIGRQILYIMEYEGLKEAAYSARITISEGELIISYVRKNPKTGEMETVNKKVIGTPVLITTTTSISIDPDMETRTIYVNIDTSEEQTKRIIEHVAEMESNVELRKKQLEVKEKAKILRYWFKTLRKYDVIVPPEIVEEVKKEFTKLPVTIRARRDFKKILYFIEAFTILHQHIRERVNIDGREYLVASKDDWEIVKKHILPHLLKQTRGLTELHDKILKILQRRREITVKDLAKELRVSSDYARKLLNNLAEKGLIGVNTSARPYKYFYLDEDDYMSTYKKDSSKWW